jgi:glycosyltransferase involved in cell wall biosynthesis
MKVLHIINSLDCGGLEKFAIDLSLELNKRGHQAEILCLQQGGDLKAVAEQNHLRVTALDKKQGTDFNLIGKMAGFVKKNRFDIVHTHNMGPLIYGTIACRLASNTHLINTRHGRETKTANPIIWALNQKIVAISSDAAEQMLKCNKINKDKVSIIPNGTDLKTFDIKVSDEEKLSIKKSLGLNHDTLILGNIGRLAKEKDQGSLIKAVKKMVSKKNKIELIMVGDGPLKKELMELAKELNVLESVKFLGYRNDIAKLLSIIDVFVLSSFTEGISLTLLEAMAAGKPIVATKVGGNPEVVDDGVTGILVPCGFPERIESAVMRFYANRSLIAQFGEAGRKRAYEFFSLENMTNQYEKLYNEITS